MFLFSFYELKTSATSHAARPYYSLDLLIQGVANANKKWAGVSYVEMTMNTMRNSNSKNKYKSFPSISHQKSQNTIYNCDNFYIAPYYKYFIYIPQYEIITGQIHTYINSCDEIKAVASLLRDYFIRDVTNKWLWKEKICFDSYRGRWGHRSYHTPFYKLCSYSETFVYQQCL